MLESQVYIAKIGKTVGLKGQLKLHIDSDFPEQFTQNSKFITNKKKSLEIDTFNATSKVVKFKGIDTIEDATRLINQQIFTTIESTKDNCTLKDDQYFWFDLEGCVIVENDITLGKITEIQRFPSSDYFHIKTTDTLVKEQSLADGFLLPYLPQYIVSVDIDTKIIVTKGAFEILEAS